MRLLRNILNSIAVAASGLLTAGCATDDPGMIVGPGSESDLSDSSSYFIAFNIETGSRTASSRAESGDLVDGSEAEHAIGQNGNYAFFFDGQGTLMNITPLNLWANGHKDEPEENIEARYWTVINPWKGELPQSVLVMVNAENIYSLVTSSNAIGTAKVSNLLGIVLENSTDPTQIGRDGELFTMTNTAYVKDGAVLCAVPVKPEMFILVEDVNQLIPDPELPPEKILKVRVERILAKATFEMTNGDEVNSGYVYSPEENRIDLFTSFNDQGEPEFKEIYWRATMTGWSINALARENYLFKRINNTTYFDNWNDAPNYRSYWAEDVYYDHTDYPWQYRRAIDNDKNYYSKNMANGNDGNILKNYSYTSLNNSDFGRTIYFPENTFDQNKVNGLLDSREGFLAGSHLIVCATLDIDENKTDDWQTIDLYRDRLGRYYKTSRECFAALVRAMNYELNSQSVMKFRYYNWNDPSDSDNGTWMEIESEGEFSLYYKGSPLTYQRVLDPNDLTQAEVDMMAAEVKGGDGKRMPWLDGMEIRTADDKKLHIILGQKPGATDKDGNVLFYENVLRETPATTDEIKSLIFEWVGCADHFNGGRMYYASEMKNPPFKIGNESVFGSVRNAWYQYKVTGVTKVGTSVDSLTDEIVPNFTETSPQLNITVRIIAWHEENQWVGSL